MAAWGITPELVSELRDLVVCLGLTVWLAWSWYAVGYHNAVVDGLATRKEP